jgi:hypothetical protein
MAAVNFNLVYVKGQPALECDRCGDLFFDRMSAGDHPRMLSSGIPLAMEHARTKHKGSFGRFNAISRREGACLEVDILLSSASADRTSEPQ